jgi:hypothetical protein
LDSCFWKEFVHAYARVLQVYVKIREVLAWELPPLTLAICKEISGKEVDSLDGFHAMVKDAVLREASGELQVCGCSSRLPFVAVLLL